MRTAARVAWAGVAALVPTLLLGATFSSDPLVVLPPVALAVVAAMVPARARPVASAVALTLGALAAVLLVLGRSDIGRYSTLVHSWVVLTLAAMTLGIACVVWWRTGGATRTVGLAGAGIAAVGLLVGLSYFVLLLGFG